MRERRMKISDFSNTFSYTPDMYFLQNVIIFWLEQGIFSQIRFWKKFPIFLGQNFFWKILICEKTPSLSQKMMIYHKKYMSGAYENVFEKSEIFVLLSLRDRLLLTICVRIPCRWPCFNWVLMYRWGLI